LFWAPYGSTDSLVPSENEFTVRFSYPKDADSVYQLLTDPELVKARSEAFGERDVRVTRTGDTLTNLRLIDVALPAFAKALFTPTNTVLDVKVWDAATKSARFTVDVKNVPTRVGGTVKLVPTDTGCDYIVDVQVSCKVPLIGRKLEAFVAATTRKALEDEHKYNLTRL
jgi:hypothetical protein